MICMCKKQIWRPLGKGMEWCIKTWNKWREVRNLKSNLVSWSFSIGTRGSTVVWTYILFHTYPSLNALSYSSSLFKGKYAWPWWKYFSNLSLTLLILSVSIEQIFATDWLFHITILLNLDVILICFWLPWYSWHYVKLSLGSKETLDLLFCFI